MKRTLGGLVGALMLCLTFLSFVSSSPTASASVGQSAPAGCSSSSGGYPPLTPPVGGQDIGLTSGTFTVNGSGDITMGGFEAGIEYCSILYSTPVVLGLKVASSAGTLHYSGFHVPPDFELNASHRVDVYRDGFLVASIPFCAKQTSAGHGKAVAVDANCTSATGSTTGGSNGTTNGGTTNGGTTNGGTTNGGTTNGGTTNGGTTNGGTTNGGTTAGTTGGTTGGATAGTTGGSTGGASTGGASTGGATSGASTGGATSGASTGGATSGGTAQVLGSQITPSGTSGTSGSGSLARTGFDHLLEFLKAAALAIGIGALLRYTGRLRAARLAA